MRRVSHEDTVRDPRTALADTVTSVTGSAPIVVEALAPGVHVHQYELIRELGRGGMGRVFLARDTRLARLVALKFLTRSSPAKLRRFLAEARRTAACHHEHIVVLYSVDEWEGRPYLALEYLDGGSLEKLLRERTVTTAEVVQWTLQIARALVAAHTQGIVHCDLKPENIYVTRDGAVKVLDFGIARALVDEDDSEVAGTPTYMSPEQWGMGDLDHRTDLWSLGLVVWRMLAGSHALEPLTQEHLLEVASTLEVALPSISTVAPGLSPALAAVIDRCLRKRPDERFANARELVAALEASLPGRRVLDEVAPFRGMLAFEETDAARFFGRDAEIHRLVALVRKRPMIGVIGPSGIGKSSLVRAGLVPALRASGERWEVYTLRPGRAPLAAIAHLLAALTRERTNTPADPATTTLARAEILAQSLRTDPGQLGRVLRERALVDGIQILLVLDQFEELFTLCGNPGERAAFLACLAGAADDATAPTRLVLAMRAEFLERLAEDRAFLDRMMAGMMVLPAMGRDGLRAALVEPLAQVGYQVDDPAIVDEMIAAVAGQPNALPLLQFTAAMLWDARDAGRRLVTRAAYDRMGGLTGALATHADGVLDAMPSERQRLARAVLLRVVTSEGTRTPVSLHELVGLGAPDELDALLSTLSDARLVVLHTGVDGVEVELAHESLIASWPRLDQWRRESAGDAALVAQLQLAARQWDQGGRKDGLLWRGELVRDARRLARRSGEALAAHERAFLTAVVKLDSRAARRRRGLLVAAFALVSSLLVVTAFALRSERVAAEEAERRLEEAELSRTKGTKLDLTRKTLVATETELDRALAELEGAVREAAQGRQTAEQALAKVREAQAAVARELARNQAARTEAEDALRIAEEAKTLAEQKRRQAETAVQLANDARAVAERERKRAEEATQRASALAKELDVKLAAERAENKRLQERKRTLTNTLKDPGAP